MVKGIDTHVCLTELFYCTTEINTTTSTILQYKIKLFFNVINGRAFLGLARDIYYIAILNLLNYPNNGK